MSRSRTASVVDAPVVSADALADAQAATESARIEAARLADEAVEAAITQVQGELMQAAAKGDAIVALVFSFEEARVRTLAILTALRAGEGPTTQVGELDALAAALEAAAPPPPVHEDACQTFSFARTKASFDEHGGSAELWDAMSSAIPSACNCKASKPKRASTATGSRGTPVAGASLTYNGTAMSCAAAAKQAATDYPAATSCANYVAKLPQSQNARKPLMADLDAGRIPAGVVVFSSDPAPEVAA